MLSMTKDQRKIRRKLRILRHAAQIGDASKTWRYFRIGRATIFPSFGLGYRTPEYLHTLITSECLGFGLSFEPR